jgi:hypothetical protein
VAAPARGARGGGLEEESSGTCAWRKGFGCVCVVRLDPNAHPSYAEGSRQHSQANLFLFLFFSVYFSNAKGSRRHS